MKDPGKRSRSYVTLNLYFNVKIKMIIDFFVLNPIFYIHLNNAIVRI